jgi:hypothetical protein
MSWGMAGIASPKWGNIPLSRILAKHKLKLNNFGMSLRNPNVSEDEAKSGGKSGGT